MHESWTTNFNMYPRNRKIIEKSESLVKMVFQRLALDSTGYTFQTRSCRWNIEIMSISGNVMKISVVFWFHYTSRNRSSSRNSSKSLTKPVAKCF
ncbi:hypothetical protein CEXT_612851 [Caerostris extrusa]|uniref:Uncharacterized protein n=1 Tax=Caerostris extrusa TaxID=172846 RepID=A0AAV4T458_CAEEX|nr:hypothetical protein CEXT_612851 [Caerostris extrusa]